MTGNQHPNVRVVATVAMLLTLASAIHALVWTTDDEILREILTLNGYGGSIDAGPSLFYIYYGSFVLAYLLLIIGVAWGRYFFAGVIVVFLALAFPFGLAISIPAESILGGLSAYVDGALLYVLFFARRDIAPDTGPEN